MIHAESGTAADWSGDLLALCRSDWSSDLRGAEAALSIVV